tara:strand:- start:209 stop:538 length:330 start_codon:yes stop_codon:yes gene_type:complete
MNNDKNKSIEGARSYKGQIIGDSMAITINFKWLLQIIAATALVVYSFWKLENRIQELERQMVLAMDEIELHEQERKHAEEKHVREMEERMEWYETELNLNPFSWGKKKK